MIADLRRLFAANIAQHVASAARHIKKVNMRRCVSFKEVEHDFKPSFPIRLARPIGAVGSFAMRPQEGVVMPREFEVRHAPPEFDLLKTHLTEFRAGIPSDPAPVTMPSCGESGGRARFTGAAPTSRVLEKGRVLSVAHEYVRQFQWTDGAGHDPGMAARFGDRVYASRICSIPIRIRYAYRIETKPGLVSPTPHSRLRLF